MQKEQKTQQKFHKIVYLRETTFKAGDWLLRDDKKRPCQVEIITAFFGI